MTPLDNIFPNETQPRPIMSHHKNHYWHNAEETNGRLAMIAVAGCWAGESINHVHPIDNLLGLVGGN